MGGSGIEPPGLVAITLKGGEYDIARRDELHAELAPAETAPVAAIDFSKVEFADSTALGCLLHLKKRMGERHDNPVIRLSGVRPSIERLLDITGLTKIFEIVPAE